jgi:peptide/nickel transport system substrate-binding protein
MTKCRQGRVPPEQSSAIRFIMDGSTDADGVDPVNKLIRANGETVSNGWANIPEVETGVDAWYEATSFEAEAAAVRRLSKAALDNVGYVPLGSCLRHFA